MVNIKHVDLSTLHTESLFTMCFANIENRAVRFYISTQACVILHGLFVSTNHLTSKDKFKQIQLMEQFERH